MKPWIISLAVVIITVLAGGVWWFTGNDDVPSPNTPTAAPTEQLTYDGAYNGALITTSEKLGFELDIEAYMAMLNRNGVTKTIIYYGVEGNAFDDSIDRLKDAMTRYADRVIPFYSTGVGGTGEGKIAGDKLTKQYQDGYVQAQVTIGSQVIKGIGEVEIYAWPVPHNDPKVKQLISFAQDKGLAVMLHPKRGHLSELDDLVAAYPQTTFLIHQFRNDYTLEYSKYFELMAKYPNVVYTIDADHIMFSEQDKIGLLYKYQDQDEDEAVQGFVRDYDRLYNELLTKSVKDFLPLVQAFPDRVTVGTEMSVDYTLDPEVYNRTIKILRAFIGQLPTELQEEIAHKNAARLFK